MDYQALSDQVEKAAISSDILLSGTKLFDESDRQSPAYKDPRFLPFYYHLGKQVHPDSVVQIGSKLGLTGVCFLQSCHTVRRWLVLDDKFYSLARSNMRLHMGGILCRNTLSEINTSRPQFDLALLTERIGDDYSVHLEFLWNSLLPEGLLVADYINEDNAFHDFCRVKNREPVVFKTRYGVGIIQR
jgi:hypothetical protein